MISHGIRQPGPYAPRLANYFHDGVLSAKIWKAKFARNRRQNMTSVTIQEVQTSLSDLIHRLSAGEWVVILENDKPVAQIMVPPTFARKMPRRARRLQAFPKSANMKDGLWFQTTLLDRRIPCCEIN